MKDDKSLKRISLSLIALVFVISFIFVFVFINIKSRNEHISDVRNELNSANVKQNYMISMERTVKDTSSDIARIDKSIVDSDGDVAFIENLESIARNNGLSIEIDSLGFEDNAIASSSGMTILKVRGNTEGGWSGTYRFLAQVESLPIKIKVNNFSLVSGVQEDVFGKKSLDSGSAWQGRFEISVLKYK